MLVHSVKEAIDIIKEKKVEFPILIVPVPSSCSRFSMVVHELDKIPITVSSLLQESFYCKKPTVHLFSRKNFGSWWEKQNIIKNLET